MALVRKSALLPYSAQQLYDLVEDFESYPQFLPWCKSARTISRDAQELCAELEVARMGISQKFSTCNRLQPSRNVYWKATANPRKASTTAPITLNWPRKACRC